MVSNGNESVRVAALVGSLRVGSLNRKLFLAAKGLAPDGMTIEEVPLRDLPLYDQDEENAGIPQAVLAFAEPIRAADAVLIVTPEYNYSIPGVLKNALDWGSRPTGKGPLQGKPGAIMGASGGVVGTRRAQLHLRQILSYLDVRTVTKPEVTVGTAGDKFDADGRLTDEATRQQIEQLLANLADWTARFRD